MLTIVSGELADRKISKGVSVGDKITAAKFLIGRSFVHQYKSINTNL